jgi:hypothetical protein
MKLLHRACDRTITYVVAARDPGVYNWLSTAGQHAGNILVRWQALPESVSTADAAVRSVRLVKLADLGAALPAETQHVTAAVRRQLVEQRATAYAHRYTTAPGGANLAAAQ